MNFLIFRTGHQLPLLFYSSVNGVSVLDYADISTIYGVGIAPSSDQSVTRRLNFLVGTYSAAGKFLGLRSIKNGLLQLCPNTPKYLNAAYDFGVNYRQEVSYVIAIRVLFCDNAGVYLQY